MPKQVSIQLTPLRSCLANLPVTWSNSLLDQKKVRWLLWKPLRHHYIKVTPNSFGLFGFVLFKGSAECYSGVELEGRRKHKEGLRGMVWRVFQGACQCSFCEWRKADGHLGAGSPIRAGYWNNKWPEGKRPVGLVRGQWNPMFTVFALKVSVDFCRNTPECDTVNVEPYTEDDWEILVSVR